MRRVKASADENNIRKLTIGDDYEHKRALAIAMDINPFEDISIKDEKIEEFRKQRQLEDVNIQINKTYKNVTEALINAKELINRYAKKEFFADANAPDTVYEPIKNLVNALLDAFDSNINLSRIFNKTIIYNGEQITVEELMDKLSIYNIPAYRILRVITASFTIYDRVNEILRLTSNNTLPTDDIPYYNNGLSMFIVLMGLQSKSTRKKLETLYKQQFPRAVDFLLNNKDVDVENLIINPITGETTRRSTDSDDNVNELYVAEKKQ